MRRIALFAVLLLGVGMMQGCALDESNVDELAQPLDGVDTDAVPWACQNAGRWRVDVEISGDIHFNRSATINVAGGGVFLASVLNNETREITHPDFHSSQYTWGSLCVVHVEWPGYFIEFYPATGSMFVGGSGTVTGTTANVRIEAYRQV